MSSIDVSQIVKNAEEQPPRQRCSYNNSDRTALVDYLIDCHQNGLQTADNNFKPVVWTKVAVILNKQLTNGPPKTPESCKQQYHLLLKTFRIVKKLQDKSGFGWDDVLKKPTATDGVWEALVKSNKKFGPFSKPGFSFPLYDKIEILSGGKTATGREALSISQILRTNVEQLDNNEEADGNADGFDTSQATLVSQLENESDVSFPSTPVSSQKSRKRAPSPEPDQEQRSFKRKNSLPTGPAAISDMADAIRQLGTSVDPQTPKRLTEAIRHAHRDNSLTAPERAKLMKLFTDKMAVADAYLAFDEDDEEMKESRKDFVLISID
ncbi:hypothetical protein ACEPAI_1500 [Sanghuangporus weigelae]